VKYDDKFFRLWVAEYLQDHKLKKSLIRTGYFKDSKDDYIEASATRLRKNPLFEKYLTAMENKIIDEAEDKIKVILDNLYLLATTADHAKDQISASRAYLDNIARHNEMEEKEHKPEFEIIEDATEHFLNQFPELKLYENKDN